MWVFGGILVKKANHILVNDNCAEGCQQLINEETMQQVSGYKSCFCTVSKYDIALTNVDVSVICDNEQADNFSIPVSGSPILAPLGISQSCWILMSNASSCLEVTSPFFGSADILHNNIHNCTSWIHRNDDFNEFNKYAAIGGCLLGFGIIPFGASVLLWIMIHKGWYKVHRPQPVVTEDVYKL